MLDAHTLKLALVLLLFVGLPVMLMRYMVSKTIEVRHKDRP